MEFKRGVEIRAAIFSLLLFPFSLYPSGLSLSLIGSRSQKLSRSRCRFSFSTSQETERETSQALGEENQSQWLSLSHQVLLSIFSTSPRIYRFQTPSLSLSLSLLPLCFFCFAARFLFFFPIYLFYLFAVVQTSKRCGVWVRFLLVVLLLRMIKKPQEFEGFLALVLAVYTIWFCVRNPRGLGWCFVACEIIGLV